MAQLLPFLLLAGVAFAAVNQALVAWFSRDRPLRLGGVLVVLAAAGAITSAVPELLDVVTPVPALDPGSGGRPRHRQRRDRRCSAACGLLLAWLLVGSVAGGLAVARHRIAAPLSLASARA